MNGTGKAPLSPGDADAHGEQACEGKLDPPAHSLNQSEARHLEFARLLGGEDTERGIHEPADDPQGAHAAEHLERGVARELARRALFGEVEQARKVSRFTLLRRVGGGGMGDVYAAYDPQLDRQVAVKVLRRAPGEDADADATVLEARAMAKLSHPNVVTVYEAGVEPANGDAGPLVFVAMAFVEGDTLREWTRRANRSWREVVDVFTKAARGLAAVHRAGLVHRDFKPDNVMVSSEDGRVLVMDFGLATGAELPAALSTGESSGDVQISAETLSIVGTPAYMAPEQVRGQRADTRTDQFAFCAALYEAIWGHRPIEADSVPVLLSRLAELAEAPPIPRAPLPRRLRAALSRGLCPDPDDRWPSMDALIEQLEPRKLWPVAWAVVGAGLVGGAWAMWTGGEDPAEACDRRGAELAGEVWSPQQSEELTVAMMKTELPYAEATAAQVVAGLDAHVQGWTAAYEQACVATHVHRAQSQKRLDLRLTCLHRRLRQADALINALQEAAVDRLAGAPKALRALVPPAACEEEAFWQGGVEPPPPQQTQQVQGVEESIRRVEATWALGDGESARAQSDETLAAAREVAYSPTIAEAALTAGHIELVTGQHENAAALFEEAYLRGRANKQRVVAAQAATMLAQATPNRTDDIGGAQQTWLTVADVEINTEGLEALRPDLELAKSIAYERAGRWRDAIELGTALLKSLPEGCVASECDVRLVLLGNLAFEHSQLAEGDEAIDFALQNVALAKQAFAPNHPAVGAAEYTYARALSGEQRFEEATAPFERAMAIQSAVLHPSNANLASTKFGLGRVYCGTNRLDEGLPLMEDAIEVARGLDDAPQIAAMQNQIAEIYSEVGRVDEASAAWEDAITRTKRAFPDGHPFIATFLAARANAGANQGQYAEAYRDITEAIELRKKEGVIGPAEAPLFYVAGKTSRLLGHPDEALAHYRRAFELLEGTPTTIVTVVSGISTSRLLQKAEPAEADRILSELRKQCAALPPAAAKAAACDHLPEAKDGQD